VIRIGPVERSEQGTGVADERHVSVRLLGDWLGGDLGGATAVGRPCHTDTRTPAGSQFLCLLLHGLAEQGREGDPSPLRLRLQRRENGSWRADGSPAELSHDA